MSEKRARYAPSPTGQMHLGNLQTALACWLQARLDDAEFILRIEDLDDARCKPEYTLRIIEDLQWLGIDWDIGPGCGQPESAFVQSQRKHHYADALEQLHHMGRLYLCQCSRKQLKTNPNVRQGPQGLVYPGTCTNRSFTRLPDVTNCGSLYESIRFRCGSGLLSISDLLQGTRQCDIESELGDVIVYRRDGVVAYHLSVVVDDIAMGVTDVLRGADLLDAMFPQHLIYQALGAKTPRYWHVPLRQDPAGQKLSKSRGSIPVRELIGEGIRADEVVGELAFTLGLIPVNEPVGAQQLLNELSLERFTSAIKKRLQHPV